MCRKTYILVLIFVFGFALCLTNGFAEKVGGADDGVGGFADDNFMPVENFEFPTAEGAAYIQGNAEYQRGPDRIIGSADFEKMRDLPRNSQDYQLGTKVGWFVVPQRGNPSRVWICTGFLVGPDLFMTNHHCIHDDVGLLPLQGAAIFMDYYQEREVDPRRGGITARVAEILRMDGPKDYALLRLDKPIGDTYGWLELDTDTRVNSSQSVKLISHPQGRSKEIVRRNTQIVDIPVGHPLQNVPFALAYLADSEGGASGSPVFLRDGTGVIAIHHSAWSLRGEPHFNAGSLMSYILPEIQQWLPVRNIPDLVVDAPQLSNDWLLPGESFTVSATVRNKGGVAASPTILRVYQSSDSIITTSDVEVGIAFVGELPPLATETFNVTLSAPTALGTYYYGACVDAVNNEGSINNNCSTSVNLAVSTSPPVYMYWTDWQADKIQRSTVAGTSVEDLIVELPSPHDIAVDVAGGHIYWTDVSTDSIQRANIDGSNVQTLTESGRSLGIALDVAGGHIYWTNSSVGSIERANLNGADMQTLVTGLSGPQGVALDVARGKMYWTDWDATTDRIQRANLDGTNIETLIPTGSGLLTPGGIALDVAGGKMYWTDYIRGSIQRANLDGTNIETLISVNAPVRLALDIAAGQIYWAAQQPGSIQRANIDGSNMQTLATGLRRPYGIALGIPQGGGTLAFFNPSSIPDQTFPVNTPITPLTLPVATGGTPPYTYTLSPIPAGLEFVAAVRSLTGTPTTVGVTDVTYTATDATNASITLTFTIAVEEPEVPINLDVNGDGQVTVIDLAVVSLFYGTRVPPGMSLPADVNADGTVDLADLTVVAQGIDAAGGNIGALSLEAVEAALAAAAEQAGDLEDAAAAPMGFGNRPEVLSSGVAYLNVSHAFADAKHPAVSDMLSAFLELLREMAAIPETSALLPNYPNPFNPETWLPYQLSTPAEVALSIYSVDGQLVRTLKIGHQPAGVYQSKHRAAYWDGKNQLGEKVASGLYFYTLTAGDFTATRKLLIAK